MEELEHEYSAVFLGVGVGAIHHLGITGEQLPGVTNALDLIEGCKSGALTSVAARVAAIAAVRPGATDVSIVYRQGPEQMSAFAFEYEHALREGVKFL